MPRKNKQSSTASGLVSGIMGRADDDDASLSSVSTRNTQNTDSMSRLTVKDHRRSASGVSGLSINRSPRSSMDGRSMNGSSRQLNPVTPTPPEGEVIFTSYIFAFVIRLIVN